MCGAIHRVIVTEMGGKNAMIVMDDADSTWPWKGYLGGSGQPASAARRQPVVVSSRRLPCLHGEFKLEPPGSK